MASCAVCEILYKQECYALQGAVFEVYREMECGFLEAVYQECLERELQRCGVPFTSQPVLNLSYKGQPLTQTYKPDLVCFGKIIVELKAVQKLSRENEAQVFNYLKASSLRLGLLINFGHYPKATIQRIIV